MSTTTMKKPKYQKLNQIEHVLHRPDMYVSSTKPKKSEEYIAEKTDTEIGFKIYKKEITYPPALLRIFIEVLSNALDNYERSKGTKTKCSKISVKIDKETGETIVWNDGEVIPIEVNEEGIHNHSMIFGTLLSGSNYDDDEERYTVGRNGVGGKICNIFSTSFKVRGFDPAVKKILTQEWTNNMRDTKGAVVKESKLTKGFTEITYYPDFEKFSVDGYSDDIIALYTKYIIDASMLCSGVKIFLNDEEIMVKNLTYYSKLYDTKFDGKISDEKDDDTVSVAETETSKTSKVGAKKPEVLLIKTKTSQMLLMPCDGYEMISFVNGVFTREGGQHVDAWTEAIFRPLLEKFNKKKDKPSLNIGNIKQYFRIFVIATVDKPVFSSQEKTKLESPSIEVAVKPADINKIMKWSVAEQINDFIRGKELVVLKKAEKKTRGYQKIEGLDQANNAGGKFSSDCSLILCEGLSAKSYAVAGIEKGIYGFSGRNWYGILALRGKLLNCRNASPTMIGKNNEITNIIKALGLRHEVDYTDDKNYKQLNYGKVILMADADCFVDDTSLLVKIKDKVSVISIESLYDENLNYDTQMIKDIKVWSNTGWVNILAIRRKKTTKKILTVNTYCGIVRTTEDHKFLLENGEEVKACDIKIGDKLLRNRRIENIPIINEKTQRDELINTMKTLYCYKYSSIQNRKDMIECINNELKFNSQFIPPKYEFNISLEESWVWGFFFADGTCGIYTYGKDREKQNQRNTMNSRKRWIKWVEHHTKKVKEYTQEVEYLKSKGENYGKVSRKLRLSQDRLEKAIQNTKRNSNVKNENMTRTNYSYSISNCDYSKLQKSYDTMKKYYPEYNWTLIEVSVREENQRAYRLVLNGGKEVSKFIETMRNRFYYKKFKKVPDEILNNSIEVQQSFYDGYYAGDGFRHLKETKNAEGFDILGQIGAQGLCYIVERLGYFSSVQEKISKPNVFTVHISKRFRRFYPGEVKKVYETEYIDRYVYDIETETGKINAGVGSMIQRQCDGIHIEALVMNFFHSLFPTLMNREEPFLISLKTPIVRVFKKPKDLLFYDEKRFREFVSKQDKKIDKKYYKGLGTTKAEDVPDTFGSKIVEYNMDDKTDFNMEKVFHKKHSDDRKQWLADYDPNKYVSLDDGGQIVKMNISDFIDGEMIKFSIDDCARNLPSIVDGLKISQRKVLYAVKKKNLRYSGKSLKVAQLGAFVAEHTNYAHGEQNLYDTIVKMANEYVGSNNIPLLYRDGMFSTRLNGKDAASARYIYTKMDMLTHLIFRQEDDVLLEYKEDDGDKVEPKFFVPILPMILVNGCTVGIGSGWSCNIPNFNPLDLINCIKIWLENDGSILSEEESGVISSSLPELVPWYRGFNGPIEKSTDTKFTTYGIIEEGKKEDQKIITELPIGMWTDKFKENLEDMLEEKQIKSMKNFSTPKTVNFVVNKSPSGIDLTIEALKLHSYLYVSNMVLFTKEERLKKYNDLDSIIDDFCKVRFEYYTKRRKHQINELESEIRLLGNKERFIREIIEKTLIIMNVPEEEVIKELEIRGYDKVNGKNTENADVEGETVDGKGYDYLLKMQIRTFTAQKIEKLKNDIMSKQEELDRYKKLTEKNLWLNELKELEIAYIEFLKVMEQTKVQSKITKKK
jgi:DNA gyrase/topoisomerase IV subunit B